MERSRMMADEGLFKTRSGTNLGDLAGIELQHCRLPVNLVQA
jgi:hypothetical protein